MTTCFSGGNYCELCECATLQSTCNERFIYLQFAHFKTLVLIALAWLVQSNAIFSYGFLMLTGKSEECSIGYVRLYSV